MDPVTHGIVGIAAGLSLVALPAPNAPRPKAEWRSTLAVVLCAFLAAELPDSDRAIDACLRPYGPGGEGLAYMLYHRGPLHTVLFCTVASAVLALLTRAIARRWSPPLRQLFLVAIAGSFLHLGMDAMNDYGVHPFYPLSERWFYGDFLFLAEPTVTATLLPYVVVMCVGTGGPRLWLSLAKPWEVICVLGGVAAFAGLVIAHQWLTVFGAVLATCVLVSQVLLQRRGPRPVFAWGGLVLVLVCFCAASRVARARAVAWASSAVAAGASVTDITTTPAPADPFCWRVITITRAGDAFTVRLGISSLGLVDPHTCFAPPHGRAPHAALGIALAHPVDQDLIVKLAEFTGSMSEFERLAKRYPRVGATRHFLRAPFWGTDSRSDACTAQHASANPVESECRQLIGDMRVDYDPQELGTYCKYAFGPVDSPPFQPLPRMPLADPPFFL